MTDTCADKLHNVTSMLSDYGVYGETLWSRFNEGPYEQEWYFQRLAQTLASDELESHSLVKRFTETVQELFINQAQQCRLLVLFTFKTDTDVILPGWRPNRVKNVDVQ